MPIKQKKKLPSLECLDPKLFELLPDSRNLRIGILMLMPSAVVERTELQFARLLANTPFNVEFIPIYFDNHKSNSKQDYIDQYYEKISDVKKDGLDGLIITGANLEQISFEEVQYFEEFISFIEWARENVPSIIFSCWSAHAALRHFYGIEPVMNKLKQFGIFRHQVHKGSNSPLLDNIDYEVYIPHSRWRGEDKTLIEKVKGLEILIENSEVGPHLIVGNGGHEVYVQGHPEYDRDDIGGEYFRDKNKGIDINVPANYFPNNDDTKLPENTWGVNGQIFYDNWVRFVFNSSLL